jgi:SAM-dependent methyltransferase
MDRDLLAEFLHVYPYQPATAVWRTVEVGCLATIGLPQGRGLDLGCGDGQLTAVLCRRTGDRQLVGIDVDSKETDLARGSGLYEAVHTCRADRIPEPDAAFDFIVSVSVLEHIDNIEPVLAEARRLLRPGGRLIASVPASGFHTCLRGPLMVGTSRTVYLRELDNRLAHFRYWSTEEWRDALDKAGMELRGCHPFLNCSEVRRWETLSRFTAGVLHTLFRHKAPIEIQRSLGMRTPGLRMPTMLASLLSTPLTIGLEDAAPPDERAAGCIAFTATRRHPSD